MHEEVYAFAAFFAVAAGFDHLEGFLEHLPVCQKLARCCKHGALVAPCLLHATRDFATHLLVYSNLVSFH